MPKDALLEIYTEEIPARFFPQTIKELKDISTRLLTEKNLEFKEIKIYLTPRRLTVYIEKLSEKTKQESVEIIGPPLSIAKDKNGNFTSAGLGFAKDQEVSPLELKIKKTQKGEYLCVVKNIGGIETEKLLPEIFTNIILGLSFPKTMVWSSGGIRFARPIRNLVALYGNKTIKIKIADVKSTNFTYGLWTISNKKIKIQEPQKYVHVLKNNYVIVDHEQRKETIKKIIEQTIKKYNLKLKLNEKLLDEINFLVEFPSAVVGKFDEKFLQLPQEIIITCLEKNQKFFPLTDQKGKLTNYFVGIRNGPSEYQEIVREGYERVLSARLNDAQFFYNRDLQIPLDKRIEKLKEIVFQEKLGTYYDKTQRIIEISKWLGGSENILYTAELSKVDLTTELVYEFPELQGIAGRIYALKSGKPQEVAHGIEQHYWPLTSQGKLPETTCGTIVSIADKIDTIVGDFAVGLIPTGTSDPYGLRRQAIGLLRIILEKNLNISVRSLIEKTIDLLPEKVVVDRGALISSVLEFFSQRLEIIFEEKGYRFDEVRAVLSVGFDNLSDTEQKIKAIKEIRKLPDFEPLIIGYKRAANIIKQAQQKKLVKATRDLVVDKLIEKEEKELFQSIERIQEEVFMLNQQKQYLDVLKKLVLLRQPIDNFFEKVMVMVEEEDLCKNRLSLLKKVIDLFLQIGDFSLLQ